MTKKMSPEADLIFIDMGDNEWRFDTPRLELSAHEEFDEALDIGFSDFGGVRQDKSKLYDAAYRLQLLIMRYPEFIDAYHHLAMIYEGLGKREEAQALWEKATNIGMLKIIEHFCKTNTIKWGWLDNRPFLRAMHSLGLQRMKYGNKSEAISIFESILSANPNDNQGIRSLLVECYFDIKRPEKVLRLCMKFPDDTDENILYGKVLALLKLKKHTRAEKALAEAFKYLPNITRELAKKAHRKPEGYGTRWLTHGSIDQAYEYWQRQGHVWKSTEGAQVFVQEWLKREVSSKL